MKQSFVQKRPYVAAVLAGVLCTFMTALGMGASQIGGLEGDAIYGGVTVSLLISIIIGLIIMKRTGFTLAGFGFTKNEKGTANRIGWYIPLVVIEILPVAFYGFDSSITGMQLVILACFTIAVGFNEEIYFRGLILKFLEQKGAKKAIIGSSVIFGVLHLINALNGKDTLYLILQMAFAFLVGFVLAEIVMITKSLWVPIIWHASHDFISGVTGDTLDVTALILLGIQVAILIVYAVYMWKISNAEEA